MSPTAQSTDSRSTERTGDPGDPGGSANDYTDTGNDSIDVTTPAIVKTVPATNLPHTTGTNVAIGEIATYRVALTVPQGTSRDASAAGHADAGLSIVDVLGVSATASLTTIMARSPTWRRSCGDWGRRTSR